MKKILFFLLVSLLLSGCKKQSPPNDPEQNIPIEESIKRTSVKRLNAFADAFANHSYNYFYQFEIDYRNRDIHEIKLHLYKDGKVFNEVLHFMRQAEDPDCPNIQYIYLGYDFHDEEKRNIDAYMYTYGPKQPDKYKEDYSSNVHPKTRVVDYDKDKRIYPIEKIEYTGSKFFINPIILNAPKDEEISKDTPISDLINDGYEVLVLEVSYH